MKKILIVAMYIFCILPTFAIENFDVINLKIKDYEDNGLYKKAYSLIEKTKKKQLNETEKVILEAHKDIVLKNIVDDKMIKNYQVENDVYNKRKIYKYLNDILYFKPELIVYDSNEKKIVIRLDLRYNGHEYYNFQSGAININGANYKFDLIDNGETVSSCDYITGCIYHEYRTITGIDNIQLLKAISYNGNTKIRFYGTNYYRDYNLFKTHITNIDLILGLYNYLDKKTTSPN